jgi:HTH-type transcriptional regulator/antitoxin HigA
MKCEDCTMARELRTLAKAFPPGDFVREELEFHGWTQQELADRMGRPFQTVNAIVNGRKQITAETALQLEEAFGSPATYWMNLESLWKLYKLGQKKKATKRAKTKRQARETAGTE